MITNTAQIIAQLMDLKQLEKLHGKGVVEKKLDDTTYLLKFPSGRITVKVSSGSLTPNTPVQVKHKGGQIILQPLPVQGNSTDSIALTAANKQTSEYKVLHELLSLLSLQEKPHGETGNKTPDAEIITQIKKLAAVLKQATATNSTIQFDTTIKAEAQKIIAYADALQDGTSQTGKINITALLHTLQEKIVNWSDTLQNSVKLPVPVQQGFIYFETGKEAVEWLVKTQPAAVETAIRELDIPTSEPVIIRTIDTGSGSTVALVADRELGTLLLDAAIHTDTKNPLWELIPADLLMSMLESKGSIPIDTLEAIDKILQFYSSNAPALQTGQLQSVEPLIQQWIPLLIENDNSLQTLAHYAPINTAEEVALALEQELAQTAPKVKELLDIIKSVLSEALVTSEQPKTEILSKAFTTMGYNFEHTLAEAASADSLDKTAVTDSLKGVLVSLLQSMPQETPATAHPPVENSYLQTAEWEPQQIKAIDTLLQTFTNLSEQELEKVIEALETQTSKESFKQANEQVQVLKNAIAEFVQQFSNTIKELIPLLPPELQQAVNQELTVDTSVATSRQSSVPSTDSIDQLLSYLLKTTGSIEKTISSLETAVQNAPQADLPAGEQAADIQNKLLTMIKDFTAILQQHKNTVEFVMTAQTATADTQVEVSQQGEQPSTPPPTTDLQNLLDALKNLLVQLNSTLLKDTAEPQAPVTQTVSPEDLQSQIKTVLQAIADALEQTKTMLSEQLKHIPAKHADKPGTEIQLLFKELSDQIKQFQEAIQHNLIDTMHDDTTSTTKAEIDKLISAMIHLIEKHETTVQQQSMSLNDLLSPGAKPVLSHSIDSSVDLLSQLRTIIEQLQNALAAKKTHPLLTISDTQHAVIKQAVKEQIAKLITPLNTALNTLVQTMKSSPPPQDTGNQLPALTDMLYKNIMQSKHAIMENISGFTQHLAKEVTQNNQITPAVIHNRMMEMVETVNRLQITLSGLLTEGKTSINNTLQSFLHHFNTALTAWTEQHATALTELMQNTQPHAQELQSTLSQLISQHFPAIKEQPALSDNALFRIVQSAIIDTVTQLESHTTQLSSALHKAINTMQQEIEQQWHDSLRAVETTAQKLETTIKNSIVDSEAQLTDALEKLSRRGADPLEIARNIQSIANRFASDSNRLFDAVVKDLVSLFEKTATQIEKNPDELIQQLSKTLSQVRQEIAQLIRTITGNIEQGLTRSGKPQETTLPDTLRQQVETTLSRLESLQLLSKPLQTSEGRQQVLSLPMRIGDEWTSVNILFIKNKEQKKKGRKSSQFSVRMYVAPSQIGAVTVNMQYYVKQKLQVRIEFEKEVSRLWFQKNKDDLMRALKKYDVASIALSFDQAPHTISSKKKTTALPVKKKIPRSNIDISA